MKTRVLASLILMLSAIPAFAADVTGTWTGSIDTPNGPVPVTYVFKNDGGMLSGTTTGPDGSSIALKDLKLTGDNLSFNLTISLGADPVTFNYTGVVSAADLKLHTDFMGQPLDFALKKKS